MGNTLWNVNGSLSTHELVTRIKASVRERQRLLGNPVEESEPTAGPAAEPSDGEAAAPIQAEVNQVLVRSLELVTHHLEHLQTQVGLVDAWIREETEQSAQLHQEVSEQMSQLIRLVADLSARVKALEDSGVVRKPIRRLNWTRLAGINQSRRQL